MSSPFLFFLASLTSDALQNLKTIYIACLHYNKYIEDLTLVFPPAPKRGMVKFPGKGHFKHAKTG